MGAEESKAGSKSEVVRALERGFLTLSGVVTVLGGLFSLVPEGVGHALGLEDSSRGLIDFYGRLFTLIGVVVFSCTAILSVWDRFKDLALAIRSVEGRLAKREDDSLAIKGLATAMQSVEARLAKKVDDSLVDAFRRIDQQVNVREVVDYTGELLDKVEHAKKIYNTLVGIEGMGKDHAVKFTLYDRFFERNPDGQWRDIIGIGDVSASRYKAIMSRANDIKVYMLRHNPPIINFIIIDYGESARPDLYFGWRALPEAEHRLSDWDEKSDPKVYFSNSPGIVGFFRNYFSFLTQNYGWGGIAGPHFQLDGREGQGLTPLFGCDFIDKAGWWQTELKFGNASETAYRAFLRFSFDYTRPSGKNEISVFLFDGGGNFITYAAHGHAFAHVKNELHFSWEQVERNKTERGYCTYIFSKEADSDCLGGYVIYQGRPEVGVLSGFRVSSGLAGRLEELFIKHKVAEKNSNTLSFVARNEFAAAMKAPPQDY